MIKSLNFEKTYSHSYYIYYAPRDERRCFFQETGRVLQIARDKKCLNSEVHIIFSSAHIRKLWVFKYLKQARHVNFKVYLKSIVTEFHDDWQYSSLEAALLKFFSVSLLWEFFPHFSAWFKAATFSSFQMFENTWF